MRDFFDYQNNGWCVAPHNKLPLQCNALVKIEAAPHDIEVLLVTIATPHDKLLFVNGQGQHGA